MCGRITYYISAAEMAMAFRLFDTDGLESLEPRYNLPPTGSVACVRQQTDTSQRESFIAKWGLIPSWAKDEKIGNGCSNARADTVDTKPAFRSSYKRQRCLVVASGFYEWDQRTPLAKGEKKQPYYFTMADSKPMAFAGLWETWKPGDREPVTSCTIITTDPNELMAPLHDRIQFSKQGQFANPRQAQLELTPFDAGRLKSVALRLRDLFPAADKSRLNNRISHFRYALSVFALKSIFNQPLPYKFFR